MEQLTARSTSAWRPLKTPMFRYLLIADFVSDVGTFLQGVGAAWLMTSLTSRSVYIALIQTASALPSSCSLLPAGSIGDILDRRKLILFTELWMVGIAIIIASATIAHAMSPWLLLALPFALSAGDAIESPSWRAIFPELVPKKDLALALALNGIEFNLARAVGPSLAGLIIAVAGVGTAFFLNVFSFVGVIWVITGWKRPTRKSRLPPETLTGATLAALRCVRYSPDIIKLLVRSACLIFFASAFLALLPSVAKNLTHGSLGYGLLLGCFGAGEVGGAVILQQARALFSGERIISGARIRRRDGAIHWGIYYDAATPGVYLENFLVDSWAEHVRQHDRFTLADRECEDRVLGLTLEPFKTRHFLYADRLEEQGSER